MWSFVAKNSVASKRSIVGEERKGQSNRRIQKVIENVSIIKTLKIIKSKLQINI